MNPINTIYDTWQICLVVRVPGYRSRGPGSIAGDTIFFLEVVGLERGPLSLVSTNEELLGRKRSDSSLEIRQYGRRGPLRWPRDTLYPQKLALTSPTSGSRSVAIVRSRTMPTEFKMVRDSSVGSTTGYGARHILFFFTILQSVQIGLGVHSAFYSAGTRGSFPRSRAEGAWSWPHTSVLCRSQEWWSYTSTPP
jgi:hypothetical protein